MSKGNNMRFDISTVTNEKIDDDIVKKFNIQEDEKSSEWNRYYIIDIETVKELVDLSSLLGYRLIIKPKSLANVHNEMTTNDGIITIYDDYME